MEDITLKTFEIYFTDLSKKARDEFLKANNFKSASEGNFDVLPIAIINIEEV